MSKVAHPLPRVLAECVAQSKRLSLELASAKQDLDIAGRSPSQDNLYVLQSRAQIVRSQMWALEKVISDFVDAVDCQVSFASEQHKVLAKAVQA